MLGDGPALFSRARRECVDDILCRIDLDSWRVLLRFTDRAFRVLHDGQSIVPTRYHVNTHCQNNYTGAKMGPTHGCLQVQMVKKTKESRGVQIKIQGTPSLKEFVDTFVNEHPKLGSRNDYAEAAFKYFAKKYEEANGQTDGNGFPVDIAAEEESSYKLRPVQKKRR